MSAGLHATHFRARRGGRYAVCPCCMRELVGECHSIGCDRMQLEQANLALTMGVSAGGPRESQRQRGPESTARGAPRTASAWREVHHASPSALAAQSCLVHPVASAPALSLTTSWLLLQSRAIRHSLYKVCRNACAWLPKEWLCLHQLPMMSLMHDGMTIKLLFLGSCVFAHNTTSQLFFRKR